MTSSWQVLVSRSTADWASSGSAIRASHSLGRGSLQHIVRTIPLAAKTIVARYPWLLIDEYQDLGPVLHAIVSTASSREERPDVTGLFLGLRSARMSTATMMFTPAATQHFAIAGIDPRPGSICCPPSACCTLGVMSYDVCEGTAGDVHLTAARPKD